MARSERNAAASSIKQAYLEVLQVSEIFDTLLTVNEGCDEPLGLELLLELLGVPELLALLGLVLEDAEEAL